MTKLPRILLLLLATSGAAWAFNFPVEIIEYIDNRKVVAFIDAADVDAPPAWRPFADAPPLSMQEALHRLGEYLAAEPDLAGAALAAIELKRFPQREGQWHYLARLRDGQGRHARSSYFVVLMNGKVIQGLREPQSIK